MQRQIMKLPEWKQGFPRDIMLISKTIEEDLPDTAINAIKSAAEFIGIRTVFVDQESKLEFDDMQFSYLEAVICCWKTIFHVKDITQETLSLIPLAGAHGNSVAFIDDDTGLGHHLFHFDHKNQIRYSSDAVALRHRVMLWLLFFSIAPETQLSGFVHNVGHCYASLAICFEMIRRGLHKDAESIDKIVSIARNQAEEIAFMADLLRGRLSRRIDTLTRCDLVASLNQTVEMFLDLKKIPNIVFEANKKEIVIDCYNHLVTLMAYELVHNAIEHGRGNDKSPITLSIVEADDICIRITSLGKDPTPEMEKQVAERLVSQLRGTSGLIFAKKVAACHGGRVEVQKVSPRGTTVCVYLPRSLNR